MGVALLLASLATLQTRADPEGLYRARLPGDRRLELFALPLLGTGFIVRCSRGKVAEPPRFDSSWGTTVDVPPESACAGKYKIQMQKGALFLVEPRQGTRAKLQPTCFFDSAPKPNVFESFLYSPESGDLNGWWVASLDSGEGRFIVVIRSQGGAQAPLIQKADPNETTFDFGKDDDRIKVSVGRGGAAIESRVLGMMVAVPGTYWASVRCSRDGKILR